MRKVSYENERLGQMEFFNNFGIDYENDDSILVDYTDGVYNGNILEFKSDINNLNRVLFQAIKYLSRLRIKGESVPATILLIDLNKTTVYVYHSADYLSDIQKVYNGSASKNNEGFVNNVSPADIQDYSTDEGCSAVKHLLTDEKSRQEKYTPIDIDENCIVGWAERYYRELPSASKGDFLGDETGTSIKVIGEIRYPVHFKDLINPYTGKTNEKFKYLMDCLNDRLSKKDLGAFYTPDLYAKKATELVQTAVEKVPDGNDYIILDRCAGTGNLESALIGLFDGSGEELISHCIVSTYEYYEYKVLQERIGDKVREIIPPTEANVKYSNGKVSNADAMTEEFINNPIIKKYIDNNKCTVILFENPPYRDVSSNSTSKATGKKNSFVLKHMREEIKGSATNDMSNWFIWSGFKYYLRQPDDSYILFSPVKYWKTCHLCEKKFIKGYLFNRSHFHASESAVSCILWTNEDDVTDQLILDAIDIKDNKLSVSAKGQKINKVYHRMSEWFDHRKKDDYIGFMNISGYNFDSNSVSLYRIKEQLKGHGSCFYLHEDNYKEKLPMFCAKLYPFENWYEKDVYATTADGGQTYIKDKQFLKACLIYTCLSGRNKCMTFDGYDGKHYRNELCFDKGTVASKDLDRFNSNSDTMLDSEEQELMDVWKTVLDDARKIANRKGYSKSDTLGVYQISKEIDTYVVEGKGKYKTTVYDYPKLHGEMETLRIKLKGYYQSHIAEDMFKYELIK